MCLEVEVEVAEHRLNHLLVGEEVEVVERQPLWRMGKMLVVEMKLLIVVEGEEVALGQMLVVVAAKAEQLEQQLVVAAVLALVGEVEQQEQKPEVTVDTAGMLGVVVVVVAEVEVADMRFELG